MQKRRQTRKLMPTTANEVQKLKSSSFRSFKLVTCTVNNNMPRLQLYVAELFMMILIYYGELLLLRSDVTTSGAKVCHQRDKNPLSAG